MDLVTNDKYDAIRARAEGDLEAFIQLVHPGSMLGAVHRELIRWWAREDCKSHSLVLLPRDHQKSRLAAYRAAWEITRNPAVRILYVSSTSLLAGKQLKFIKDILELPIYKRYWPEMLNNELGLREKWTETEFAVDHPQRKAEAIRDPTVITAGLTTNIVGLHCDFAFLDDVVTPENAYTETGREAVKTKYGLLASIEAAEAVEIVVGTRYHPRDLYNEMMDAQVERFDVDGNITEKDGLYDVFSRVVEDSGDGSGNFLWPRTQRKDGKWFGFNRQILATKKAQYRDISKFRAQYYNDPNDTENAPILEEWFQYYDPKFLSRAGSYHYYNGRRLNVFAAIDFAFSTSKAADFTSIVTVGVDANNNIYVLDIDRFKSGLISDYFKHILEAHTKWGFNKIRAEVSVGQAVIVRDLKENYIRPNGLVLSIDENRPTRQQGSKAERINAALQARYQNGNIWHNQQHNLTQVLEEELQQEHPQHDDIKDTLASVMDILVPPMGGDRERHRTNLSYSRFGGIL